MVQPKGKKYKQTPYQSEETGSQHSTQSEGWERDIQPI